MIINLVRVSVYVLSYIPKFVMILLYITAYIARKVEVDDQKLGYPIHMQCISIVYLFNSCFVLEFFQLIVTLIILAIQQRKCQVLSSWVRNYTHSPF